MTKSAPALWKLLRCGYRSSGSAADGVVSAVYNDRIGQLTFLSSGSNLHYWHVKHCYGLINDGDPVALDRQLHGPPHPGHH